MNQSILQLLRAEEILPPPSESDAKSIADLVKSGLGLDIYPQSIVAGRKTGYFLARNGIEKQLIVVSEDENQLSNFDGEKSVKQYEGTEIHVCVAPTNEMNAAALRAVLPFLNAKRLGLEKSAGCGDRLGLATPGHVRAVRQLNATTGTKMGLIAAQQSVRENSRTGRNPQQVMDEAMWGIFQEGWRDGFGGDADHLKTPEDTTPWIKAGFTFYTIDPGEHVDDEAENASGDVLRKKVDALPWDVLDGNTDDLITRFSDPVDLGIEQVTIDETQILRAAAKYGKAVAHTVKMYRHLASEMGEDGFELEVSVDETATVTRIEEHIYIANELKRLGVQWVSLAPRYVGEFEKGVDYIGDIDEFKEQFALHVAIAKKYGPYKLSLHSGSDKFSIYPIVSDIAGDLVHLKTAGTSYLEALRTVAKENPDLFKVIMEFAMGRYETDRATYFVSGELENVPAPDSLSGDDLVALVDQFDARQVLHVTFGSVLNHEPFGEGIDLVLKQHEETHYDMVATHFDRHLQPFG